MASQQIAQPGRPDDKALVAQLAAELGETAAEAQVLIKKVVRTLGAERTRRLVDEAKAIEADGGMLVPDGSRRRTLGGVFFKLAKERASPEERARIWSPKKRRPQATPTAAGATAGATAQPR